MNQLREEKRKRAVSGAPKRPERNFLTLISSGEWGEKAVEVLPYLLFLTLLALVYIADRHYAENVAREIHVGAGELKELRWEYITTKAELMHKSQQTQVAERARSLELQESVVPPVKIRVSEELLDSLFDR